MEDDNPLGFLDTAAALEVQILVSVFVRHTCYNCTGLPKDFGLYGLQNQLFYKSQPPGLWDMLG